MNAMQISGPQVEYSVRIRIRQAIVGVMDGVSLSHFVPGLSYEVSDSLGGYLITNGVAEEVFAAVALVNPEQDSSESAIFGGVTVAKPADTAADHPHERAPRRRKRR